MKNNKNFEKMIFLYDPFSINLVLIDIASAYKRNSVPEESKKPKRGAALNLVHQI